ncbi:helix-turn-helix domain-containing protein [Burkholderia stagnalis]|uniref:helix-turn-helix domain-containing protein n=1 Tax=Burkholderia stagnalis TaxID=1503054 RepID=UPI001E2E7174|nr:helix-turn-helix domain-containing protein [Burkholderia stagnalis]
MKLASIFTHFFGGTGRRRVSHSCAVDGRTPIKAAKRVTPLASAQARSIGSKCSIEVHLRHCLEICKGIADWYSALPNASMETIPNSQEHIGDRLRAEMDARNMSPADVASLFGVKPPSVYDWLKFGRIAKKHLPRLVEIFGHTMNWWISGDESENDNQPSMPAGLHRIARVLEGRSTEEIERIAQALELLLQATPASGSPSARRISFNVGSSLSPPTKKAS